jgi:hypothetical protein
VTQDQWTGLIALARSIAEQAPGSMDAAAAKEVELQRLSHDLPGYEDLEVALSMFRPGEGDHLFDEEQLRRAARGILHDLGDHALSPTADSSQGADQVRVRTPLPRGPIRQAIDGRR